MKGKCSIDKRAQFIYLMNESWSFLEQEGKMSLNSQKSCHVCVLWYSNDMNFVKKHAPMVTFRAARWRCHMCRKERPVRVSSTTTRKNRAEKVGWSEAAVERHTDYITNLCHYKQQRRSVITTDQYWNVTHIHFFVSTCYFSGFRCALSPLTAEDQILLKNMQELDLLPLL